MPGPNVWPFKPYKLSCPTNCEYFIYLKRAKLPPQMAYMARMQRVNPFEVGTSTQVTPEIAMLFSDIRLRIALILREKNAHVFRPDLFEEHVVPSNETLAGLSESVALAKIQYHSAEPLPTRKHLPFMAYLAEAISSLTAAPVLFDVVAERLMTSDEFFESLQKHPLADSAEFHLETYWRRTGDSGIACTRGMNKIGLPEIETPPSSPDHSVLLQRVLAEAGAALWQANEFPEQLCVRAFDDEFRVDLAPSKKGLAVARVHRIHST